MLPDPAQNPVVQALMVLVVVVFTVASLAAFFWRRRRRQDFTHGVRGTGTVLEVRPTGPMQRYSAAERPTERVVVATAAVPRGLPVDQKFPLGTFAPGQQVPVVQRPGDPTVVRVVAPGQVPSALAVYGFLVPVLFAPVAVVLILSGGV